MSTYDLNDEGKGSGKDRGAQAIVDKSRDDKKPEFRLPVPGRGQESSSPISEDGNDKELLKSICQLHRQIKADHKPAKDIMSAIDELKTEIRDLISELDDSEENTEAPKQPAKCKPGDRKAIASGTNRSKDLYTVATTTKKKCRKLHSDLVITRKEMKEISELAVAVGQEVGFQPGRRNTDKDRLSLNAKEALADIKRMNRALSEELNKLSKNIERYSTDQTKQQPKQPNEKNQQPSRPRLKPQLQTQNSQAKKKKDQTEEKKDHKSSQFDTNLEIIFKVVNSFDDLQQYKGLSKLADNKLTEDNPNIANFGDPNRSTKIAEVYSEIYDKEWTDALIFCHTKLRKEYSEDEALQALNKTLIICYKICQEKSDEWMEKTKGVLQRCSRELMVDIQSEEILMQIIEGQRVVSDKVSEQLLKEIRPKNDLVATKYAKEMNSSKLCKMIIQNKFFEKCFTLCWKMIVQNPRMILVEGPSRGNTYDRDIFREFKSSGSKVVFTVWPALYLHEDGPLLVKGALKVE